MSLNHTEFLILRKTLEITNKQSNVKNVLFFLQNKDTAMSLLLSFLQCVTQLGTTGEASIFTAMW